MQRHRLPLRHRPPHALALGLLLVLAACGGEDRAAVPGAGPLPLSGPPRWRLLGEARPGEGISMILNVRTPVRVRFSESGTGHLTQQGPWRELAAGQSLRVDWGAAPAPADPAGDRPGRSEREAGRTDLLARQVHYQFADEAVTYRRLALWARPDRGHVAVAEALPPGRYEALPLRGEVELLRIALSDLASGAVTLRRRGLGSVLGRPESLAPDDQLQTWRLVLEIEPLEG